ncbi:ribonuclease E [Pseudoscardovia radai]|uniref:Ribonuclease E n=1 Tax=Pseudoscardovia radai TaxID=987066 RepID=A0A261EY59_9BIFI|nr:hypothetical protein [Pseudoscardovia radai]OZG51606.1 ribonuclease E [Pseudoscardovia radai]
MISEEGVADGFATQAMGQAANGLGGVALGMAQIVTCVLSLGAKGIEALWLRHVDKPLSGQVDLRRLYGTGQDLHPLTGLSDRTLDAIKTTLDRSGVAYALQDIGAGEHGIVFQGKDLDYVRTTVKALERQLGQKIDMPSLEAPLVQDQKKAAPQTPTASAQTAEQPAPDAERPTPEPAAEQEAPTQTTATKPAAEKTDTANTPAGQTTTEQNHAEQSPAEQSQKERGREQPGKPTQDAPANAETQSRQSRTQRQEQRRQAQESGEGRATRAQADAPPTPSPLAPAAAAAVPVVGAAIHSAAAERSTPAVDSLADSIENPASKPKRSTADILDAVRRTVKERMAGDAARNATERSRKQPRKGAR